MSEKMEKIMEEISASLKGIYALLEEQTRMARKGHEQSAGSAKMINNLLNTLPPQFRNMVNPGGKKE